MDYSTDQVDWLPELAAYRYVRLRGSNPNAPYHVIDLGIVAAQGGTATMLGVNIEYSIDDTTWHDPPRHTDDNWFRFTVGTGGTPSDGLPLSGAGGGGVTNLDVENITGTGFDISSSTGTDASVPAATTTDAGLLTAADKTKLDGLDDDRQLPEWRHDGSSPQRKIPPPITMYRGKTTQPVQAEQTYRLPTTPAQVLIYSAIPVQT